MSIKAIVADKVDDQHTVSMTELDAPRGEGEVVVNVDYSTINFKDGLAVTGASPIMRSYPLVLGIDLAGTVESSDDARFAAGDAVLLNGYGLSESRDGGFATQARVPAEPLIKIPAPFDARDAMAIGTAGYTAMLCVLALEDGGVTPESGPVLVTGAAGGVGSVAIALLKKLGYTVIASSGRAETESDYLKSLGAAEIIDRTELSEKGRPLGKERWAGAVDSVGSTTLANVLASTGYGGTVAACGLAQGMDLPATVMPFILRGVKLAGVDSVMAPRAARERAWARLATDLDPAVLGGMIKDIALEDVLTTAPDILAGKLRGRTVVKVS